MTDIQNKNPVTPINDLHFDEECAIEGNINYVARSFEDLNIKNDLLKGIFSYGFERPSPIQSRAILPCIQGRDVLAQAQSGTGKTATFVISSLQLIDTNTSGPIIPQVIVVVPTRELATQIKEVYVGIGQYLNIKVHDIIGGVSVRKNIDTLKTEGAHVIVGTPGRIMHLISNGSINMKAIKVFILDEADTMLDRGFLNEIYQIFKCMPPNVQVILLSATMPDDIKEVSNKFMRDPIHLSVKVEQLTLQGIKQFHVQASDRNNKVDAIIDLLGESSLPQTIVFVNKLADAEVLCRALKENNFNVEYLHSELTQAERTKTMDKFRADKSIILVATDLVARGIDVQKVGLVINFDLPDKNETYLHRIGRSGRFGRKGVAISLVSGDDFDKLKAIEEFYQTTIKELPKDFKEHF